MLSDRLVRYLFLIACLVNINKLFSQNQQVFQLNNEWQFYQADNAEKHKTSVPGIIFTDLFYNKITGDPFYGCNSENVRWVEDEDWIYENIFSADDSLLKRNHIELVFEGWILMQK